MNKTLRIALAAIYGAEADSQQSTAVQPAEVSGSVVLPPEGSEERQGTELGERRAKLIHGAEGAIEAAYASEAQTRMDGAIELASLSSDKARVRYLSQIEVALKAFTTDGKLPKKHSTYISELRRVHANVTAKLAAPPEAAQAEMTAFLAMLQGPGTYAEKMAKVPRIDARGGSNRDKGTAGVTAVIKDMKAAGQEVTGADMEALRAMKESGLDPAKVVAGFKKGDGATQQPSPQAANNAEASIRNSETGKAQTLANPVADPSKPSVATTGPRPVDSSFRDACNALTDQELESAIIMFSNRLKRSDEWVQLGNMMYDWIDHTEEPDHAEVQPATGTNG